MTHEITEALDLLVGDWQVTMTTTSEEGEVNRSDSLHASKKWIGDGRYILEEIQADFGIERHKKVTLLGYNRTLDRFENVTADNHDGVTSSSLSQHRQRRVKAARSPSSPTTPCRIQQEIIPQPLLQYE